jgi:hypothetical protein
MKFNYIKPSIDVIAVRQEDALLNGVGGSEYKYNASTPTDGQGNGGTPTQGEGGYYWLDSKKNGNLWDDSDE